MKNAINEIISVTTDADYKEIEKLIKNVFKLGSDIPDQIFNKPFNNFLFQEFDLTLTPNFWDSIIQSCSFVLKEEYVIVAVLEPNPLSYFYQNFGYFNWFRLPLTIDGDDYWKILEQGPKESPADAILFNSETVIWLPSSLKWAIWGNRSYGVCIIAFQDNETKIKMAPLLKEWVLAQEALDSFMKLNFKDGKIPLEFYKKLIQNFSKAAN